jgi:TATA-binding protein-associated factor Taf7
MSETETVELSPTENLVNALEVGNFTSAEDLFNTLMNDKVQDALDAEKVSVAGQIFNGVESDDLEVTDEEIDAALESGDFEDVEFGEEADDFE